MGKREREGGKEEGREREREREREGERKRGRERVRERERENHYNSKLLSLCHTMTIKITCRLINRVVLILSNGWYDVADEITGRSVWHAMTTSSHGNQAESDDLFRVLIIWLPTRYTRTWGAGWRRKNTKSLICLQRTIAFSLS